MNKFLDTFLKSSDKSTINDWLQIKIGGDEEVKKKKRRQGLNRIKTTKYTFITFLPQNLLEQFRRIANFYFLVIAILTLLIDSPVSPTAKLLPLALVIAVTAAKQGYEDILRYKTDNIVNCSPVTVIRNGVEEHIESQDVSPGDLVLVKRDCDVPCDLVLIRSSDPHGKCFITTANLDGESNLKTLLVPRDLPRVDINGLHKLGVIKCESSKTDLYSFNGKIELTSSMGRVLPLNAENVLLRGSRVKNTECVIGCAIYTGMTTKLQLNSRLTSNKFASSETYINRFLIYILIVMMVLVTVLYFLKRYEDMFVIPKLTYLGPAIEGNSVTQFLQDYLSFVILLHYLIPITLYLTIELHRAWGGLFMQWDRQLYDETTDQPCIVNTTNLNEELGQINILFSDKTGTLTKNEMIFQQCSIAGRKYMYQKTRLQEEGSGFEVDINTFNKDQISFFQALTICHTVQVVGDVNRNGGDDHNKIKSTEAQTTNSTPKALVLQNRYSITDITKESHNSSQQCDVNSFGTSLETDLNGVTMPNSVDPIPLKKPESQRKKHEVQQVVHTLDYQASSPDEKALVEACAHLGLVYIGDDDGILKIHVVPPHMDYSRPFSVGKENEMSFDRLHVLEFTSDRKRMSVIVKDENDIKWIYTKGAESYVFPLCSNNSADMIAKTDAHINDFASLGLRTLAVARRKIKEDEYKQFSEELNEANSSLENRKELSEKCYAKIESNLDLLGATAVEDALQDDVADTLISLQKAGIKICVLTGDKVETALNIALSCGHIPQNAFKYFIIDCGRKEDMLCHLKVLDREIVVGKGRDCALLIDGKSLTVALTETPNEFRDIAIKCKAVLCCRLSPLQKSEVVSLIKTAPQNFKTAAIGDGANDVSMIQEAHVGIGIVGKEGRQAARCADFAFAKFCMLKRLLLVHGHYHTTRLSLLVLYFFYKNIFFMGIMLLFQFHSLFSTSSIYDTLILAIYNLIFTALPIFFISLTEKPFTEETLMREPELYKKIINNKQLHWPFFLAWTFYAIYHTLICFYFAFLFFSTNNVILNGGQTAEFSCFGILLVHLVVIVVNLKLWLESKYLSYWYIFTIIGSILVFMATTVVYNIINVGYGWAYIKLLSSMPVWLFCIVTIVACLLPDFTFRMAKRGLNLPQRRFFPGKERKRLLQLQCAKKQ